MDPRWYIHQKHPWFSVRSTPGDVDCPTRTIDLPGYDGGLPLQGLKPIQPLEPIAMTALHAGRILMEAGANASSVEQVIALIARGLGAERVDSRIGYASLAITVGIGDMGISRMTRVGHLGVNDRLGERVWHLAKRVSRQEFTPEQTAAELVRLSSETPSHALWVTAPAVGLACAAFGRLLAVDWYGIGPVVIAATLGQYFRSKLLAHRMNTFICTTLVSCFSSVISGLAARWVKSDTFEMAMVASILLLVPGVPAVNAQSDILEGHPTLGSARMAVVLMTIVFMAAGLWVGQTVVALLGI
jgi:uncharacterized membrane protein YjjP (DUF1212 family)